MCHFLDHHWLLIILSMSQLIGMIPLRTSPNKEKKSFSDPKNTKDFRSATPTGAGRIYHYSPVLVPWCLGNILIRIVFLVSYFQHAKTVMGADNALLLTVVLVGYQSSPTLTLIYSKQLTKLFNELHEAHFEANITEKSKSTICQRALNPPLLILTFAAVVSMTVSFVYLTLTFRWTLAVQLGYLIATFYVTIIVLCALFSGACRFMIVHLDDLKECLNYEEANFSRMDHALKKVSEYHQYGPVIFFIYLLLN